MGTKELDRLVDQRDQTNQRLLDVFERTGLAGQILPTSSTGGQAANFVDSDYLGFAKHPQVVRYACMGAKQAGISNGMPRLLGRSDLSERVETEIAQLVQQEKAVLFPSTTHIALDVLPLLSGNGGVIFLDDWAYPISQEGAYTAIRRGAKLIHFSHNDHFALENALRSHLHVRDKVIICDGVYSAGGGRAALKEISLLAEQYGAVIYVDDAHGLGILGIEPKTNPPYGLGGGGTALYEGIPPGNIIYVSSLSKAFGVPLAFVAGPAKFIEYLSRVSKSFVHSSQPALPVVAAAWGALQVNKAEGDRLRQQLAQRVAEFRRGFKQIGIPISKSECFPIQSIYFRSSKAALQVALKLRKTGIWPLLQISPIDFRSGAVLRFVISVGHNKAEFQRIHDLMYACR